MCNFIKTTLKRKHTTLTRTLHVRADIYTRGTCPPTHSNTQTCLPLALPNIHVDELRPLDRQEAGGCTAGNRLGQQCLTTPRRTIQQHTRAAAQATSKQRPARAIIDRTGLGQSSRVMLCGDVQNIVCFEGGTGVASACVRRMAQLNRGEREREKREMDRDR
jgi:hypothetical protein